jgi:DNA (cytosine-5)-methyltransferase 1
VTPAYYNEIDPFAAAWLRSLIAAGHIAPGDVDERSITDVSPDDLVGYGQCHFFAGIGGWSLALRLAGVPDDEPVWTGSCPCQPFSVAGLGKGTDDARHLWPEFRRLIAERRPSSVFGEQVASGPGRSWLAAVRLDLEALGYGVGAADLCAAGVGAPHVRQRLWWGGVRVADADGRHARAERQQRGGEHGQQPADAGVARGGHRGAWAEVDRLADADQQRRHWVDTLLRAGAGGWDAAGVLEVAGSGGADRLAHAHLQPRDEGCPVGGGRDLGGDAEPRAGLGCGGVAGGLGDSHDPRPQGRSGGRDGADELPAGAPGVGREGSRPSHVDWQDADWLGCRDGQWRPVEPGSRPLVDGVPARVGRLRGYGNAIVPEVAAAFVSAFLECAA